MSTGKSSARHTGRRLLASVVVAFACLSAPLALAADNTVVFGSQAWPGATIKTEVARQILERLGYDTEVTSGTSSILSLGLRQGDIDVMLENWMPDMKHIIKENLDSGKARQMAVNIEDARLGLVVPAYVWNEGIHSIADLQAHAEQFDHEVLGIETGNVDNEIVKQAISDDTYGLADWRLRPSSTAAMMAQVAKEVNAERWVVFIGWRPHWMNLEHDLKYLDDPEGLFGDVSQVLTLANSEFVEQHPNVARFLRQYIQSSETETDWIYNYGYEKHEKHDVASDWIDNHEETVAEWLDGVTTADGENDAMTAMQ